MSLGQWVTKVRAAIAELESDPGGQGQGAKPIQAELEKIKAAED